MDEQWWEGPPWLSEGCRRLVARPGTGAWEPAQAAAGLALSRHSFPEQRASPESAEARRRGGPVLNLLETGLVQRVVKR